MAGTGAGLVTPLFAGAGGYIFKFKLKYSNTLAKTQGFLLGFWPGMPILAEAPVEHWYTFTRKLASYSRRWYVNLSLLLIL